MAKNNWVKRLDRVSKTLEDREVAVHETEQRAAIQSARRAFVKEYLNPLEFMVVPNSGNLYSEEYVKGKLAAQIVRDAEKHGLDIHVMSPKLGEADVAIDAANLEESRAYKLRIADNGSVERALAADLTSRSIRMKEESDERNREWDKAPGASRG